MADAEHPVRLAGLAVVGTLGVASLIAFQWVIPTMTASLTHEKAILTEQLKVAQTKINVYANHNDELLKTISDLQNKEAALGKSAEDEIRSLKAKLFESQQTGSFVNGSPYPAGLDKVRIGDPSVNVKAAYGSGNLQRDGRYFVLRDAHETFRIVRFWISTEEPTAGTVQSIDFYTDILGRIRDRSLPSVPDEWIAGALTSALGVPKIIGLDEDCSLWRPSDEEVVYYINDRDYYTVSGFVVAPAGCSVTDAQLEKYGDQNSTSSP